MFDFCFNKVNILIHIFAFVLCGNRFINISCDCILHV